MGPATWASTARGTGPAQVPSRIMHVRPLGRRYATRMIATIGDALLEVANR